MEKIYRMLPNKQTKRKYFFSNVHKFSDHNEFSICINLPLTNKMEICCVEKSPLKTLFSRLFPRIIIQVYTVNYVHFHQTILTILTRTTTIAIRLRGAKKVTFCENYIFFDFFCGNFCGNIFFLQSNC